MKQLEIILTRIPVSSVGETCNRLQDFRDLSKDIRVPDVQIGFYSNTDDPNDLSVIVFIEANQTDKRKSDLGLFIADEMRNFGLVSHSCWVPVDVFGADFADGE